MLVRPLHTPARVSTVSVHRAYSRPRVPPSGSFFKCAQRVRSRCSVRDTSGSFLLVINGANCGFAGPTVLIDPYGQLSGRRLHQHANQLHSPSWTGLSPLFSFRRIQSCSLTFCYFSPNLIGSFLSILFFFCVCVLCLFIHATGHGLSDLRHGQRADQRRQPYVLVQTTTHRLTSYYTTPAATC